MTEKVPGNGVTELGAHGRTRTAGLLLTKELLCPRGNCGGLADLALGRMATNGHTMATDVG